LENIANEFYQSVGYIVPKGVSSDYTELVTTISQNLLFNIGLSYILYFAGSILLILILIRFNFFQKLLSKLKIDQETASQINSKINDLNGNYYRNLAEEKDRSKMGIELKLLYTDFYSYHIFQFSIFLSIGLLIVPYITHEYVFFVGKFFNLPFLLGGIETYLKWFQFHIITEFIGISLMLSMGLMMLFFKNNIIVNILNKFIIKNLLSLYNYADNDLSKGYAIKRVEEFKNENLKKLFYSKIESNKTLERNSLP
jgi:hypothetical protein